MSCSPTTIQPCRVETPSPRTDSHVHPVPDRSDRCDKACRRFALPELVKSQTTPVFPGPSVPYMGLTLRLTMRDSTQQGERLYVDIRQDCPQPLLLPVESHEAGVEVKRRPP